MWKKLIGKEAKSGKRSILKGWQKAAKYLKMFVKETWFEFWQDKKQKIRYTYWD